MKKTVYAILISTLFIGLGLIVMEQITMEREFEIPSRLTELIIDLSDHERVDELLFTRELEFPSTVEIMLQSDSTNEKTVRIVSDSRILGRDSNEILFSLRDYTGDESIASTITMQKGKYSVYLTSEKVDGRLAIGYQDAPKDLSEYKRLEKIDQGDLNNPPEGYIEIYSVDLEELNYIDETVYTLSIPEVKDIGISVYTSSNQGNFSVDLVGESLYFYGLVYKDNKICDQLETVFHPGEYQFKLNCENANGQLYIYLKQ